MRARGLYGMRGYRMEIRERELEKLAPNEVLFRVRASGVCGTDVHFLTDLGDMTPMGHEIAGEVVETGAAVARWRPGMRAVCEDVALCGACDPCKAGRTDLCRSGVTLNGQPGIGDYLVVDERMLVGFGALSFDAAAMIEPLAVAMRCIDKLEIAPDRSLLIVGTGAIALLACAYAKVLGAGRVVVMGRSPASARGAAAEPIARSYGADEVRFEHTDELFDDALIAAPPSLAAQALERLKYGGTALAAGVAFDGGGLAKIDVSDMVFHKKSLITSLAEPARGFPKSAKLIESGRIDAARIITHRLSMDDAPAKLEDCYRAGGIKVIILP